MGDPIFLYVGSTIITLWGAAHIIPTKSVVAGFSNLSSDNRRIITMEWIAEGLGLCFIGIATLAIAIKSGVSDPSVILFYRLSSGMLIVMAVLSLFTGARTSILPMKLCPAVKTLTALLFVLGTL